MFLQSFFFEIFFLINSIGTKHRETDSQCHFNANNYYIFKDKLAEYIKKQFNTELIITNFNKRGNRNSTEKDVAYLRIFNGQEIKITNECKIYPRKRKSEYTEITVEVTPKKQKIVQTREIERSPLQEMDMSIFPDLLSLEPIDDVFMVKLQIMY